MHQKKKSDPKSPGLPWRCGGRLGVHMSSQGEYEPQTGQKTSTASKATLSICLMRTKVVASSPICKSSVVDLVMSRDHQNDNAVWLCRFTKKKKSEAKKGTRSRAHLNRRPLAPKSAVYHLGYLGIDECMRKKLRLNHVGDRHGVLDSRSGKSVWCAFDKTWQNPNLVCFACQITCAATDVGHCAPEPTRTPQKTQKATPSRSPA